MDFCPLSNRPCPNSKIFQYTIYNNGYMINHDICQNCDGFCEIKDILFNSCHVCGMCLFEIQKTKKTGCANCYEQFNFYLKTIVKECQDQLKHLGKKPENIDHFNFKNLIDLMDKAIQEEKYELAQKCKLILQAKFQYPLDQ